jgi:hypothetical protein
MSSWAPTLLVIVYLHWRGVHVNAEFSEIGKSNFERRLSGICLSHADNERSTLYSWCAGKSFASRDTKATTAADARTFQFVRREEKSDRLDERFMGSCRASKGRNLTVTVLCCEGFREYDIRVVSAFDPASSSRSLNVTVCAQPLCGVLVPTKWPQEDKVQRPRPPALLIDKLHQLELREKARNMFIKAYDSYMNLAYPKVC